MMIRRAYVMAFSLLVVSVAAMSQHAAADAPAPDAEEVIARIRAEGPRSIVEDDAHWFSVLDALQAGLGRGDPKWVEVTTLLRPSTDAGSAIDLEIAVGRALPLNPAVVLGLADAVIPLRSLCPPFFDEDEEREVVLQYLRRTEKSLLELTVPELTEKRLICLGNIRAFTCDLETCPPRDMECYEKRCRHLNVNPSTRKR